MLELFESEAPVVIQCSCTMFLCSKLNLVEPQPGVPQNSENSLGLIFLKVLPTRHELQDKHSPEKRRLVLLTLSTLKHSVWHTVQYWSLTESHSLLGDGWKGRSHFKLLSFVLSANLSHYERWWASTLLPHKSTRHMQNRKIFTQLRLQ